MAETLGSLCDKLTIVKLKQWHLEDPTRLQSLVQQEKRLASEINEFVRAAVNGSIPAEYLTFPANKVYKQQGNSTPDIAGRIGELFARLARVNCDLWHEQEKVYEFEKVPAGEKDKVVKRLALLNLERNQCIDGLDTEFRYTIESARSGVNQKE